MGESPFHIFPLRREERTRNREGFFFSFSFKTESYNPFLSLLLAAQDTLEVEHAKL